MLIRRKELDGAKPYSILTLAGFVFWMAVLHWLRLPYWATGFGWVALSFYFAFYLPVFIGLSRIAVHQLRMPVILAAPIVWTGLELARAHLLTGMTMASLGHTQYRWMELIQISDLAGAYGVSFVVMFVAACIARALPCEGQSRTFWPLLPAAAILAAVLGYGYARTANNQYNAGGKDRADPRLDRFAVRRRRRPTRRQYFQHYFELSRQAVNKYGQVDLIVWPETYFIYPLITYDADAGTKDPEVENRRHQHRGISGASCKIWVECFAPGLQRYGRNICVRLCWSDSTHGITPPTAVQIFNSAVYVSASGKLLGRYDKMHLVMFGEYIPFADYFTVAI